MEEKKVSSEELKKIIEDLDDDTILCVTLGGDDDE